ncbi:MAG: TolC family protein [Muribaculaceae bacterium]|nr:TolC family protein [Muribaculaceae bacterium]
MKSKLIFLEIFCLLAFNASSISIEECQEMARNNYPAINKYHLVDESSEYNLSNVAKAYLPQISISISATYQSDVTKIPLDFSSIGLQGVEIPSLNKDQYNANVEVNQIIWDGGVIKAQKGVIDSDRSVSINKIDVELYAIKKQVSMLYFGIMLTDLQLRQNQIHKDNLRNNYERIQSYIDNGIANQSDLDVINVDILNAEQNRITYSSMRKAYIKMLSNFIGKSLDENVILDRPIGLSLDNAMIVKRPELNLFNAQIKNLKYQDKIIDAVIMPKLGMFVKGGYGRPGLNMLEPDFQLYYMAGLKLSWNIGNLYKKNNNKRLIKANIDIIENQKDVFMFNINQDSMNTLNLVNRYSKQLKNDDEIIALRTAIREMSVIKMSNGTISGADLVRDINAENAARQDRLIHEIELLQSIYNLKILKNN